MTKWADYLISAVRYNSEHAHIVKVQVHKDNGDSIGVAQEWTRDQVVSARKRGDTFVTIFKQQNSKWNKGQNVNLITVGEKEYIRTDQNHRASDNLENLPEF